MQLSNTIAAMIGLAVFTSVLAADEPVDYRLPPGIRPVAQSIELRLDPGKPDYSGKTVLRVEIASPVERIGIYQIGLEMSEILLRSGTQERVLKAAEDDYDINWLSDGAVIPAGLYELSITYTGKYSTDALGMHRSHFEGNDYIFTQMEAMYLRRAVPSFDEPSFKVPYKLTITAPAGLTVVANTPVETQTEKDGWQRVEFFETKPLSSYLVAYAVGPLDRAEIKGMSVPGSIYVPKGHAGELGFVLRHAPAIVNDLEEYFGIPYPFRKLDFIAVPDFAFGAMENAGLITYRADSLLLGDHAAGATAAWTLSAIAHEVAHMWFGDLVTMAWWNDIWLNESFATWMNDLIMLRLYPEFDQDLRLPQTNAFNIDQGSATKPVRREMRRDADVNENGYLRYVKGHAVLRALESYVGAEQWRAGVQSYLKKYAWSNATELDLWNEMSAVSGMDVSKIAGTYLNQPGIPFLSIDKNGGIEQSRYLPFGIEAPEFQWTIPLNVKYKKDGAIKDVFYLLDAKTGVIDLPKDADWIMPDADAEGYFRWQIDLQQFHALVDDIGSLENKEKIAFLDNAAALLAAHKLDFQEYMLVLTRMLDESHPLVLLPAIERVLTLGDNYVNDDNAAAFARFIDARLGARLAEVGIETHDGDSEALIQLRPRLVRLLGQYGSDPELLAAAARTADLYLKTPDAVDSNLAVEVLRVTALNDDGKRYDKYISTYLESTDVDQRTNILKSIYFTEPAVVRKALDFSISDKVSAGDASFIIALYPTILDDHTIIYEWLEKNLAAFEKKIPAFRHPGLPSIVAGVCNEKNLALMRGFFSGRDEKYATNLYNNIETLSSCIAERKRNEAELMEFLAGYE